MLESSSLFIMGFATMQMKRVTARDHSYQLMMMMMMMEQAAATAVLTMSQ